MDTNALGRHEKEIKKLYILTATPGIISFPTNYAESILN
jgi:hypothetical protein